MSEAWGDSGSLALRRDAGVQKFTAEQVFRVSGPVFSKVIVGGALESQEEKKDGLWNFISVLNIPRKKFVSYSYAFNADLTLVTFHYKEEEKKRPPSCMALSENLTIHLCKIYIYNKSK